MTIIARPCASVNPDPPPSSAWQSLDLILADRLAWANDSPSNDPIDGYPGPGWQDDPAPHEDGAGGYELGWSVGYAGGSINDLERADPGNEYGDDLTLGYLAGREAWCRGLGHDQGYDGRVCVPSPRLYRHGEIAAWRDGHAKGLAKYLADQGVAR